MRPIATLLAAVTGAAGVALANPLLRVPGAVFPVPHVSAGGNGIGRIVDTDVPVSGPTPFGAACGTSSIGTLYVNAEVEPSLAVNPRDARHWIAAWQQDRWSSGSSRGLVAAVTFDAGGTWTRVAAPFTACAGGEFARASDPWVEFAPDGTAYQIGLASTGAAFFPGSANAIVVSRSADGGLTWTTPVALIRDTGAFFNDKETITADPFDARFVYAVWDRIHQGASGPTYFSRTTDGGLTWEAARPIHDPGGREQTIGNLIRVLPDGTLVNLFTHLRGGENEIAGATLEVIRSPDRGATWSEPSQVAAYQPLGVRDPATRREVRDGTPIAQMAAAPDGALYVVWQDGRFSGVRDAIAISRSNDAGRTWSTPSRVSARADAAAFAPQVAVAADGTIAVTYFDLRSDTPEPATLLADYWLARSRDGVRWTESHLAGPFDLGFAPDAGGLFLGDYMGIASSAGAFLALYARTTADAADPTNVYVARVPAEVPGVTYGPLEAKATRVDAGFERRVAEALAKAMARRPAGRPAAAPTP